MCGESAKYPRFRAAIRSMTGSIPDALVLTLSAPGDIAKALTLGNVLQYVHHYLR